MLVPSLWHHVEQLVDNLLCNVVAFIEDCTHVARITINYAL